MLSPATLAHCMPLARCNRTERGQQVCMICIPCLVTRIIPCCEGLAKANHLCSTISSAVSRSQQKTLDLDLGLFPYLHVCKPVCVVVHLQARVPLCRLPALGVLSCDLATGLAEGACRAKLDTQSSFGGSSLRSSSLRSQDSLGRDSTASLTETMDSVDNGDDEPGISSKQPTGTWPSNTC
jgi:hypothetical protein